MMFFEINIIRSFYYLQPQRKGQAEVWDWSQAACQEGDGCGSAWSSPETPFVQPPLAEPFQRNHKLQMSREEDTDEGAPAWNRPLCTAGTWEDPCLPCGSHLCWRTWELTGRHQRSSQRPSFSSPTPMPLLFGHSVWLLRWECHTSQVLISLSPNSHLTCKTYASVFSSFSFLSSFSFAFLSSSFS